MLTVPADVLVQVRLLRVAGCSELGQQFPESRVFSSRGIGSANPSRTEEPIGAFMFYCTFGAPLDQNCLQLPPNRGT